MPIDADAYMAGAIPTLSRGGSWVPYDASGGGGMMSQPTSPSGPHMPVTQPSIYTGMPQQVLGGFFQNPLMLGRMAAFGSSGMEQPSQSGRPGMIRQNSYESSPPLSPHQQRRPSSSMSHNGGQTRGSVAGGSPLRYGGWTGQGSQEPPIQRRVKMSPGEQSGVSPSLLSSAGHRRSHSRESGSWERGSGAPEFLPAEADYGRIASARPPAPKSLPLSEVERQEDKRRYRSQPRSRRPDRLLEVSVEVAQEGSPTSPRFRKPSSLSGISPIIQEETSSMVSKREIKLGKTARFARPGISRRHTSQDTVPPPEPRRTRVNSTPQPPVLDMRSMRDALSPVDTKPESYVSQYKDDEYDRYVAHPAVHSPTTVDRTFQQEVLLQPISGTRKVEYTPLGYAGPTKELEWNRDGPAMKTYGVAWKREANVLPAGPEGPRWVQARPPRAAEVKGGGWWESGGQGIDAS